MSFGISLNPHFSFKPSLTVKSRIFLYEEVLPNLTEILKSCFVLVSIIRFYIWPTWGVFPFTFLWHEHKTSMQTLAHMQTLTLRVY